MRDGGCPRGRVRTHVNAHELVRTHVKSCARTMARANACGRARMHAGTCGCVWACVNACGRERTHTDACGRAWARVNDVAGFDAPTDVFLRHGALAALAAWTYVREYHDRFSFLMRFFNPENKKVV